MKARFIPVLVMLFAGFITCVLCIINGYGLFSLLKILLCVLIVFFLLGFLIRVVVEFNFRPEEQELTADDLGFVDGEIFEDELYEMEDEQD